MQTSHVDPDRTEEAVSSLPSSNTSDYQPRTLRSDNAGRCAYLPIFPTTSKSPRDCLLLSNVATDNLGTLQITQRQHASDTVDALTTMDDCKYSSSFTLYPHDAEELAKRLQVPLSIITFNTDRLRQISCTLLAHYQRFQEYLSKAGQLITVMNTILSSIEVSFLLEFFLQIDVDTFYMKTCSFDDAESQSASQTLFYEQGEPEARYKLVPCGIRTCPCCNSTDESMTNQSWKAIDFDGSSMHRFLNGYTTYLNCSATCGTPNIIYAMTCPCGKYDYVQSTGESIRAAMIYHRINGNKLIYEYLTGYAPPPFPEIQDPQYLDVEVIEKMFLYQHAARCPAVLKIFLDSNPKYWCFIPVLRSEAEKIDLSYLGPDCDIDIEKHRVVRNTITVDRVFSMTLRRVPTPPEPYEFSYLQRQQQYSLFHEILSLPKYEPPYSAVDLYKMKTVAVLPGDCSRFTRFIIETLFIIHCETKLNMICPLSNEPDRWKSHLFNSVWCRGLNQQSWPMIMENQLDLMSKETL